MLGHETYREWTLPFSPEGGSTYTGNWEEVGSEMRFIGSSEDGGENMGMVSIVREVRKPEFVSVEHIGIFKGDAVDTTSDEAKKWTPSFENYTLVENDGGTEVRVEVDVTEEYVEMFKDMWPQALQKLKEICER